MTRNQKQKFRALRFVKHLARFVDSHRYPNFLINDEMVIAESERQSKGESALTKKQLELIKPLRDAQRWKEITIDGIVSEMADWWSKGWGWFYPITSEIDRIKNDWVMKKALLKIRQRCHKDFLGYLIDRGGCERYMSIWLDQHPKPTFFQKMKRLFRLWTNNMLRKWMPWIILLTFPA